MSHVTTIAFTMLLLCLIFVQDLLELSDSFKDSRIRIDCQEMGDYENSKCSHQVCFNDRRHNLKTMGAGRI